MINEKILIVEDDLESLKLIGLMLQRRGYQIIAASDGDQALAKAESDEPNLVILDVMMPGLDGYDVCRQLRSNPETAHLPVIMFSAKALMEDKAAGFEAGADDYLSKPIHPAELVSHVEMLLQSVREQSGGAQPQRPARVIGIIGAKGGVGTSTIVVNLAVAAGQLGDPADEQRPGDQVRVVDLRPGLGTVALLLGQAPRGGWSQLLGHSPAGLDRETIESQLMTYSEGLRYLPASLQPENGQSFLSPDHVDAVLGRMRTLSDILYLDLGCVLDEATRHAIAYCDLLIVVVEPERVCLALAQALLEQINHLEAAPADVRVVMVERTPGNTAYLREKVEELLGRDLAAVIGPATEVVRQAAELGEPLVLSDPESAIAAQLKELGRRLLA